MLDSIIETIGRSLVVLSQIYLYEKHNCLSSGFLSGLGLRTVKKLAVEGWSKDRPWRINEIKRDIDTNW